MARFRRFRRSYSRPRRSFRGRGRSGGNFILKWGVGAVAGVVAPRVHPLQDTIITALAVAPIRLPYGVKGILQGYVGGMLAKPFLGAFGGAQASGTGDYV